MSSFFVFEIFVAFEFLQDSDHGYWHARQGIVEAERYKLHCDTWYRTYIRMTNRYFHTRYKEHKYDFIWNRNKLTCDSHLIEAASTQPCYTPGIMLLCICKQCSQESPCPHMIELCTGTHFVWKNICYTPLDMVLFMYSLFKRILTRLFCCYLTKLLVIHHHLIIHQAKIILARLLYSYIQLCMSNLFYTPGSMGICIYTN